MNDGKVKRYVLYATAVAITITTAGLLWNTSNVIGAWFFNWAQAASAKRFEDINRQIAQQAVHDSLRFEEGAERDSAMLEMVRHLGAWAVIHANDVHAHRAATATP